MADIRRDNVDDHLSGLLNKEFEAPLGKTWPSSDADRAYIYVCVLKGGCEPNEGHPHSVRS